MKTRKWLSEIVFGPGNILDEVSYLLAGCYWLKTQQIAFHATLEVDLRCLSALGFSHSLGHKRTFPEQENPGARAAGFRAVFRSDQGKKPQKLNLPVIFAYSVVRRAANTGSLKELRAMEVSGASAEP